jgi:DNA-binding transcriptional ArsR family regulator
MAYEQAMRALADPTRRQIFEKLRAGPRPVGRLADGLTITRPAVSQHLRVLEGAGLVRARREGTRRIYAVEIRGLQELRQYLDRFWDDVLESFRVEADRRPPGDQVLRGRTATPNRRRKQIHRRGHGKS